MLVLLDTWFATSSLDTSNVDFFGWRCGICVGPELALYVQYRAKFVPKNHTGFSALCVNTFYCLSPSVNGVPDLRIRAARTKHVGERQSR